MESMEPIYHVEVSTHVSKVNAIIFLEVFFMQIRLSVALFYPYGNVLIDLYSQVNIVQLSDNYGVGEAL